MALENCALERLRHLVFEFFGKGKDLSYYTLNLGFNVNDSFAVKQGGFEGPPASPSVPPLLQSQMWLKSEVPPGTGTTYTVLDGKGIQVAEGDEILVRLFSAGAPAASMMAQNIIVFGRRHIDQTFRTPFTLGNRNARTILNSGDRNRRASTACGSSSLASLQSPLRNVGTCCINSASSPERA